MSDGAEAMVVVAGIVLFVALVAFGVVGYVKCDEGEEWKRCYPNHTCDARLTCLDNHCVPMTDGGAK